jgi:hypothetical protein
LEAHRTRPSSWAEQDTSFTYRSWYVRWHGRLTGPGSYGHMGAAGHELLVDSILEVGSNLPPDCQIAWPEQPR